MNENLKSQMFDLVKELNAASDAYYNSGNPIMSDLEFDLKLKKLQKLEDETGISLSNSPTQHIVVSVLNNIQDVVHKTPMLSLAKCHSADEVRKFGNGKDLSASVKLDGLSCRLVYEDGNLIRAESRGNGIKGNDITEHVKQFIGVPLHIDKKGTYVIDGEALIRLDDFAIINTSGEYKNSRNLAAGTLSTLDISVVKQRRLTWYAWEIIDGENLSKNFYERLHEAQDLGFQVVPHCLLEKDEYDDIDGIINLMLKIAADKSLPQDGVVFKFDDVAYGKSLGNTSHHFRNGIAFKAAVEDEVTTLREIEWTMGKTGVLTPVAIFDSVELEGTTVNRASLHNISIIKELELGLEDQITVYKANLIIPQLRDNLTRSNTYTIPDKCPICGCKTEIRKDNDSEVLICTNSDCAGKLLGKLSHFVSRDAINIDGLSEATIHFLLNRKWVNCFKDLYHLKDYTAKWSTYSGFGKKSVEKILAAIEKSRTITLPKFLYALSIPLVGKSASDMISKAVDNDFGEFMSTMTIYGATYFNHLPGVGNAIIKSLDDYFIEHCSEIFELSKEFAFEIPKTVELNITDGIAGKTFVITGSVEHFANRNALKKEIEAHGGKVSGSISTKSDYLICNEISSSEKCKKAQSLNIPIISEEDFLKMLND